MFSNPRWLAVAVSVFLCASSASAQDHEFLTVTSGIDPLAGPFSQFNSHCDNGYIRVTHTFFTGGPGLDHNNNIFVDQSAFPNAFPNAGNQIQGHLGQTLYGSTALVTFNLSNYNYDSTTVFGMWNTTDESIQPPYRIELLVNNIPTAPTMFQNFLVGNGGTDDNVGADGVLGRAQMDINLATGDISAGAQINGGNGIHTNARFWHNLPPLTSEIRVYVNLQPAVSGNPYGDGVGYYFAEICIPEPTSGTLFAFGLFVAGIFGSRKRG